MDWDLRSRITAAGRNASRVGGAGSRAILAAVLWATVLAVVGLAGSARGASLTLRPNAVGTYTQWGESFPNVGTNHWQNVDEVTADDSTTRLLDNTWNGTEIDTYRHLPTGIGAGCVITNVQLCLRARQTDNNGSLENNGIRFFIRSGATDAEVLATSQLPSTWTNYCQSWTTDPATGAGWSIAAVDALEIGARNAMSPGGSDGVELTQVWMVVSYLGTFQITQPAPNSYTNQTNPTAIWTTSVGAASYQVQVSFGAYCQNAFYTSPWITTTSLQLPTLGQSWYSLCVTAKDNGGSTLAASNSGMIFNVDLTPPVDFTISSPTSLTNNNRPTVTWTRAAQQEYGSPNYTYTLKVGTAAGCASAQQTYSITSAASSVSQTLTTALADGAYVLCLVAQDPAGNTKNATNNNYPFTVDTTPPGTFTVGAIGTPSNNARPTVSWSAASGAANYTVAFGATATCSPAVQTYPNLTALSLTPTSSLADGTYYACVTAYDAAGNSRLVASNAFTVDATPPGSFSITSPTSTYVTSRTFNVGWGTASGASSYDLWLATSASCPGAPINQTTTSHVFTVASDGAYYVCVKARDAAGNVTTATNSGRSLIVDTVPPGAVTIQNGPDATARRDYVLNWTAVNPTSELLAFEVRKSRGATCNENPTIETFLSSQSSNQATIQLDQGSGPYLICVTAVDSAGNRTTSAPRSLMSSIPLGNQDMAIIAVRSPDQGTTPTAADLAGRFAGPISDRFKEISFNQFWITPTVFDLPRSSCGDPTGAEVAQAITATGHRVYDYDHLVILRNCGGLFSSQYNLQDPQRAVPGYGLFAAFVFYGDASENSGTLIQETMHGFGLYFHADSWSCTDAVSLYGTGCVPVEYGNPFDAMGSGYPSININAYYKEVTKWLGPSRVLEITAAGRYTIRPYNSTTGYVAAKLRHPQWPSSQPQYYLEYRKNAVGADAGLSAPAYSSNTLGLMLNTGFFATSPTGTNSQSWLVDVTPANGTSQATVNPGSSYSDAVRGITVSPVGPDGNGDMVFDVSFPAPNCATLVKPYFLVDSGRFSTTTFHAGVQTRMDNLVTLYDFNNPVCYPSGLSYSVKFLAPAGWTATPDTFTVTGWSDRRLAGPSLTPPAGTAPGNYSVQIEVRNNTTGATVTSNFYNITVN